MIRKATYNDLRKIYKLERVCFKRGFQRIQIESLLLNPNAISFVYMNKRRIIGSLILYFDGYGAKVLTIAVHPKHRRGGIGKRLMRHAETVAKSMRAPRITLEVSTGNMAAINLYKSLGFQFEGVIKNYYSWGDDAYTMAKKI